MGLFSRKKPQSQGPLPPVPRFPAPSGQALPSYEPEFPHPEEHQGPEFPEVHAEPVTIPPPPPVASFPRPQVDDKSQPTFIQSTDNRVASMQFSQSPPPAFARTVDERLPSRQEPIARPAPIVVPHPEAVRVQQYPPNVPMRPRPTPIEIPVREPAFTRKPVQYPDRAAIANEQRLSFQRAEMQARSMSIPDRPLPQPMMPPQPMQRAPVSYTPAPTMPSQTMSVEDKPLFIKIGQYREAMSHLELLKQKIKDAENALAKLEDLRAKEQTEITNAHTLLATVKDKLLAIDKQLFDV